MLPVQLLFQDNKTELGESKETHCTLHSFLSLTLLQLKILIEENLPIGKPTEPISNWLISMYLRMVLVQELAQASQGQKTMFLNGKFRHFRVRFWPF